MMWFEQEEWEKTKERLREERYRTMCFGYAVITALLGVFFSFAYGQDRDIYSLIFSIVLIIMSYRLFSESRKGGVSDADIRGLEEDARRVGEEAGKAQKTGN